MEKAEAEYVGAKLDLHKKTEIKEQLTEHLCAIIQQNELRKARKLEELMLQLELGTDQESLEAQGEEGAEIQSPVPAATVNETRIQTDCTDINVERVTVEKMSEGQERELFTATASGEV